MTWMIAALALVGAWANVKRRRWCFLLWMISNVVFAVVDYRAGQYAQCILYGVYFGLAVWGWFAWGKKGNDDE